MNWTHRWAVIALAKLGFRWRVRKSLDDLDQKIRDGRLRDSADGSEGSLDVDALASTDELRLIIGLHLDGWSWHEISKRLRNR